MVEKLLRSGLPAEAPVRPSLKSSSVGTICPSPPVQADRLETITIACEQAADQVARLELFAAVGLTNQVRALESGASSQGN